MSRRVQIRIVGRSHVMERLVEDEHRRPDAPDRLPAEAPPGFALPERVPKLPQPIFNLESDDYRGAQRLATATAVVFTVAVLVFVGMIILLAFAGGSS